MGLPGPARGHEGVVSVATPGRFERTVRIRFGHCDPAGIVFYPQYLVLINGLVEDWLDASPVEGGLGLGFADLIGRRRVGLPTVRLECDFRAVSRMGDDVVFALEVERLGSRSLTLAIDVRGLPGDLRLQARVVIVTTSLDHHRAIALPDDLRAAVLAFRPHDDAAAGSAATISPDSPTPDARSPA